MRRSLRGGVAALTLAAASLLVSAIPAAAITGGEPDGEGHPNVALIAFYDDGTRYRCTATLVNPTTMITAAHCTQTNGYTLVTFSTFISNGPTSGLPVASNPAAGYSVADITESPGTSPARRSPTRSTPTSPT